MTILKFLKKFFRLNNKIDKQLELTAYHESGHIVLAYFYDYTCDSLELNVSNPGAGQARLNYGHDLMLIVSITNSKTEGNFFNSLDKSVKARSPQIANIIALVLLAGSVAEATFLNGGKVNGNMEVEISGPDLVRVDNIHYFLSIIDPTHNPDYISNMIHQVLSLMSIAEIWKAVDTLAKKILEQHDYKIGKVQIEEALKQSGFFSYKTSL